MCVCDLNYYPRVILQLDPVLFCQQYPCHIWKIALNGVVVLKSYKYNNIKHGPGEWTGDTAFG